MFPVAVNIALLPEQAVWNEAIRLSDYLALLAGSAYRLGSDGDPHITLLQGVIDTEEAFQGLVEALGGMALRPSPQLHTQGFTARGPVKNLWWSLENQGDIVGWHQRACQLGMPWLSFQAHPAMFTRQLPAQTKSDCAWVSLFPAQACGPQYLPHLTLGRGSPPEAWPLPATFKADRLAIYQMGPYCSCAKLLHAWSLR
jgi:hypothetical protein